MVALAERQQQTRLAHQMRKMIDDAKAKNRDFTSAERESYDKLMLAFDDAGLKVREAELDEIPSNKIDRASLGDMRDQYRLRPGDRDDSPHGQAFSKYVRAGVQGLSQEEVQAFVMKSSTGPVLNTMSTTTGSQGGFIIPTGFSGMLEEALKWFGGIDGTVQKFQTATGNPWPWPTVNDTNNRGRIIGQNVQLAETDLVFGQITFSAYIGSSDIVLVPLALVEDSYFNLDALLAKLLGIRLGRLLNFYCTQGTGAAQPTGIVPAVVASGNVLQLAPGSTNSISYNNLVDLEHSVDPAYRYNDTTRWMFSDAVLKTLKKLVDGNNRPLWQPGLTASFREGGAVDLSATRPTILDHPYIVNQDLATPAASQYTMLFGDLSKFALREVGAEEGGVTLMRLTERFADWLQIAYLAWKRWDSNLLDAGTHPIAVLQQSAT